MRYAPLNILILFLSLSSFCFAQVEDATPSYTATDKSKGIASGLGPKQELVTIPRLPATPPLLIEAEGKVISVNRERSPLPTIEVALESEEGSENKEVVTISLPQGAGIIKNSQKSSPEEIKAGDKVDIWYRERNEENIAEMISVFD